MTEDEDPSRRAQVSDAAPAADSLAQLRRDFHEWVSAASEAGHAVREAIANIGDGLAKIANIGDEFAKIAEEIRCGKGVLWLGLICARDALQRSDLSEGEKRLLAEQATSFQAHMSEIINSSNKCSKDAALGAAMSALWIGIGAGFNDLQLQKIWAEARRQQIARAITALKAEMIDDLIIRLSEDLWRRRPQFKGNPTGTAETILPAFNEALSKLSKLPKRWPVIDLENSAEKKAAIDRIRKRISRLSKADNRRLSI
jgi:hypothetical protein